ncbi:MAG: hypothetical protein ACE5E6_01720 [Phycisphaerae bacterium]
MTASGRLALVVCGVFVGVASGQTRMFMTPYVCPDGTACDPLDAGACGGVVEDCVVVPPEMTTPGVNESVEVVGGDVVAYDVWLEETAPVAVQTWQVWMFCSYGADGGEVAFASVSVDDLRCDYIFPIFGLCPPPTTSHLPPTANQGQCPSDVTNLEPRAANVAQPNPSPPFNEDFPVVTAPRYLSTWRWVVSADAEGVFTLMPECLPVDGCTTDLTKLFDPGTVPIAFTVDPLDVVLPSGQCCNGSGGPCVDVPAGVCAAAGGVFDPDLTCGDPCCVIDADCDDGSACTANSCVSGLCVTTHLFDEATECCDPSTGVITPLDDGNDCTDDICNADGSVSHPLLGAGTPCGDGASTTCTAPDTCDGAGVCAPNDAPAGTPCGLPDDTVCTDPDTCDGLGACQPNDVADGTVCDDGTLCTTGDACASGVCTGAAVDCDDGIPCTVDGCDPQTGLCTHDLAPATCVVNATCFPDGAVNPDNDCEACDSGQSTSDWSPLPAGTLCDDGDPCTGTGAPGIADDTCDGAGVCAGELDPECNDDCATAIPVTEGQTTGTNVTAGPDDAEASCQPDSNHDVWFAYTATCSGTVFVSTLGSVFVPSNDTVLSVFDACGGAEIACDDDSGVGLLSALSFVAVGDATYWIRVAGFADNVGDIVLTIGTVTGCLIDGTCYAAGDTNPANDCEVCTPEVSTTTWSLAFKGMPCGAGDPSDAICDSPDTCDGAGVCEANNKPDGTPCSDEGNACTFDVCATGLCVHPPVPSGTACGDPSVTECDLADTCDGAGVCLENFVDADTPCGSAVDTDCDNPDTCDGSGLCSDNFEPSGTVCTDDGNECTDDVCDGAATCTHPPTADGTPCTDDGNECTVDSCSGGVCAHPPEPAGTVCDDADACTVADVCLDGVCDGTCIAILYGDVSGDGLVEVTDLLCVQAAANGTPDPACGNADIWPCPPNEDGIVEAGDVLAVLAATNGMPPCPDVCPPCLGACCIDPSPQCEVLTQAECLQLGGVYQGDDTVCDPNPCP